MVVLSFVLSFSQSVKMTKRKKRSPLSDRPSLLLQWQLAVVLCMAHSVPVKEITNTNIFFYYTLIFSVSITVPSVCIVLRNEVSRTAQTAGGSEVWGTHREWKKQVKGQTCRDHETSINEPGLYLQQVRIGIYCFLFLFFFEYSQVKG